MKSETKNGYAWAISAGFNAALAAISAKYFTFQQVSIPGMLADVLQLRLGWCSRAGMGKVSISSNGYYSCGTWIYFQCLKYALVVLLNVIMWGCYVNSMKSLSSLQATVTNFATNFLTSGMSGYILFDEALPLKWFAGAVLIVIGVIVLSKSSIEKKTHTS